MGALEEIEVLLFRMIICGISSISAPSYEKVTASELALLPCTTIKRGGGWHRTTGRTSLRCSERKPTAAAAPQAPQARDTFLQRAAQQLRAQRAASGPAAKAESGAQRPKPPQQAVGRGHEGPGWGPWGSLMPTPGSQGGYTGALHVLSWDQGRNRW